MLRTILISSLCLFLLGARGQKITITGSSTVAPLALEIAKRYERLHPGTRIDVQTGGSSRGIRDAKEGLTHIGMISRSLRPQEKSLLKEHTIARDGIGIILHATNKVSSLTNKQIEDIFTGKITNWKDVGGSDRKVVVVNKAEGRSTLELFLKHFHLKPDQIKASVIIGDNQQGIKTISRSPESIGYVSIGAAEYSVSVGTPLKLLPMGKIPALTKNVANGTFPLSRSLNFVTKTGSSNSLAQSFIMFSQSKEVHDLIEEQYFIPLKD